MFTEDTGGLFKEKLEKTKGPNTTEKDLGKQKAPTEDMRASHHCGWTGTKAHGTRPKFSAQVSGTIVHVHAVYRLQINWRYLFIP